MHIPQRMAAQMTCLMMSMHLYRLLIMISNRLLPPSGSRTSGYRDGEASQALFRNLRGVAVNHQGDIVVSDSSNHCLRKLAKDSSGMYQVETVAGNGQPGFSDAKGRNARFCNPVGIAYQEDGTIVCADSGNNRIRLVHPDGRVSTLAGNGSAGTYSASSNAKAPHPSSITLLVPFELIFFSVSSMYLISIYF